MKKSLSSAIKKAKDAVGGSSSRRSRHTDEESYGRREASSREGHHQEVLDVPPERARDPESGLLLNQQEYQKYFSIRHREFEHTGIIDPVLLDGIGMTVEFNTVFNEIGWGGFWQIQELGIKMLTIEFLCSLQVTHDGVYFRIFNQGYNLTWGVFSIALEFDNSCQQDLHHATGRFRKADF